MNKKKVVVVSTYVDKLIKDLKPDIDFYLFNSISGLSEYLRTEAIRADQLILTREILMPVVGNSLSVLYGMLSEFNLKIEKVYLLTEKGSQELRLVDFFLNEKRLDNWEIIHGVMTREYISDFICGNIRGKDITPERKIVVRRSKSEWKREQLNNQTYLESKYNTEEELLKDVPIPGDIPDISTLTYRADCRLITVTGIESRERTLFYYILGQYLASSCKVLLIERDYEYHTLSDMVIKSEVPCTKIKLSSIFLDIHKVMHTIRTSLDKLIIIIADTREKFNYTFLSNVLYNNLSEYIDYILLENSLEELSTPDNYLAVIPSNVPDLLKTVDRLPNGYKKAADFVMVDVGDVEETKIKDSNAVATVVKELLNYETDVKVPILRIESTILKGHPEELRPFVKN